MFSKCCKVASSLASLSEKQDCSKISSLSDAERLHYLQGSIAKLIDFASAVHRTSQGLFWVERVVAYLLSYRVGYSSCHIGYST
jgi:hypothetical protein